MRTYSGLEYVPCNIDRPVYVTGPFSIPSAYPLFLLALTVTPEEVVTGLPVLSDSAIALLISSLPLWRSFWLFILGEISLLESKEEELDLELPPEEEPFEV